MTKKPDTARQKSSKRHGSKPLEPAGDPGGVTGRASSVTANASASVSRGACLGVIDDLCAAAGVSVPSGWAGYFDLAKAWGARTDLTGARGDSELAEILFLDASRLIATGWVDARNSFVDVGAGVGAPTIPLLLGGPEHRATLVEPRRIRTAFLRSAIGSLELMSRARVLEQSVDPRAPVLSGAPFDVAVSRATFSPQVWRDAGSQLGREVWVFTAGRDLEEAPDLCLVRRVDYAVPSTGAPRSILAYTRRQ